MKAEKTEKRLKKFFLTNFFSKSFEFFPEKVLLYGDLQLDIINYSDLDHAADKFKEERSH